MSKPDKYFLEIQTKLSSKDEKVILKTISEIRQSGQANIIPLLVKLLDTNTKNEISKEVIVVLGQLKDKEVIPYVISELKSEHTKTYRTELIMTCWQSGLDYSAHIDLFVDAFIHGDFQTAIESFSVIEEWIHNSPKEVVKKSRQLLIDNLIGTSEDKKAFYQELIKLVEGHL